MRVDLRSDDGNAAVELVMLAPALLLLIAVVVSAGRMMSAKSAVESVAREAARSASQAPDSVTARSVALSRADETAAGLGLDLERLQVVTDEGSFERGAPLAVSVVYKVRLSDLPGFGLIPGSFDVASRQVELIERYKSR